jgi:hypothetical protein
VIYTGRSEPNLCVVREFDNENDDPEMHFTVYVVEDDEVLIAPVLRGLP